MLNISNIALLTARSDTVAEGAVSENMLSGSEQDSQVSLGEHCLWTFQGTLSVLALFLADGSSSQNVMEWPGPRL